MTLGCLHPFRNRRLVMEAWPSCGHEGWVLNISLHAARGDGCCGVTDLETTFPWHTCNGSSNWVKFCSTIYIACQASGLTPLRLGLHRFLAISSASWKPFFDSNSINATRNCLFRETCIIGLTEEINCINPNTKWRTVVFSLSENFSPNRNHVAAIRPIGKMKNSKIITIIKVVDFKAFFSPLNLALASSETWQARIRFSWRLASLYTRTWRQMIELNNAIVTTVTGIIVALDKKR